MAAMLYIWCKWMALLQNIKVCFYVEILEMEVLLQISLS